ncbi:MAG: hypothetical protein RI906_693 [Pseudomonadota bacterium]|jgi:mRNA-degrading endonuclease HigB of HigAB toxin-antitoxin module
MEPHLSTVCPKAQYRSASVPKNRRVVFNIKGNDYRQIVAVAYKLQIVYVKFVGTHKTRVRSSSRPSSH